MNQTSSDVIAKQRELILSPFKLELCDVESSKVLLFCLNMFLNKKIRFTK